MTNPEDGRAAFGQHWSADPRINLNPGTLGTPSRSVREAMEDFRLIEGFPLDTYAKGRAAAHEARAAASILLPGWSVALGSGTTVTMSMLTHALVRGINRHRRARPIRVLTTAHEHEGGVQAFVHDPDIRVATLSDDALADPDRIATETGTHRPDVVFLSHALWTTGKVLDLPALLPALASAAPDALILVDAAQSAGVVPLVGADAVVASGHKWLAGPPGTGMIWLGPRLIDRIGGLGFAGDGLDPEASAAAFECGGGQDFARFAGLACALTALKNGGLQAMHRRVLELARFFAENVHTALAGVPHRFASDGGWVAGPSTNAGVVCVQFDDRDPYPVYASLNRRGVYAKCIKRTLTNGVQLQHLRFGAPFYETEARLDRACAAVAAAVHE